MQANFYELYTTYLVNIFATLNNLNLKIRECNHHIIAFHSSGNFFKVTLKWWHLYQKHGVFPYTQWTLIEEEPVPILGKIGAVKNCTLVLNFLKPKPPNPSSWMPNLQLKSTMLILKTCQFYLIFHLCHYYLCHF